MRNYTADPENSQRSHGKSKEINDQQQNLLFDYAGSSKDILLTEQV